MRSARPVVRLAHLFMRRRPLRRCGRNMVKSKLQESLPAGPANAHSTGLSAATQRGEGIHESDDYSCRTVGPGFVNWMYIQRAGMGYYPNWAALSGGRTLPDRRNLDKCCCQSGWRHDRVRRVGRHLPIISGRRTQTAATPFRPRPRARLHWSIHPGVRMAEPLLRPACSIRRTGSIPLNW